MTDEAGTVEVPTERVRTVAVVGHRGTGKSTLVEAMLRVAGHGGGSGLTTDVDPEEVERGHSLGLGVARLSFDGAAITLFDLPGGAEVIGDAYPTLAGADAALFVVDASAGIEPQHTQLWREVSARGIPRLVFLNKLDLTRARYQDTVDALRGAYGRPLAPVHMPIGIGDELHGVIDLLHFRAVEMIDGERITEEVPEERREQAARNRELLVEAIVETDDDLLVRYLDGDTPGADELDAQFAAGIADAAFFPVLCGSATEGIGVELLLHFLVAESPSPVDGPHPVEPDGPTAAVVIKTLSDQYVGRINVLRVLRGSLTADDHLTLARTGADLRLHRLFGLRGDEQLPIGAVAAGDVVAVAKLDDVETGDLLHDPAAPPPPVTVPEPPEGYHRVVLVPDSAADDDKLSTALQRHVQEDPSISVTRDAESHTTVLGFYGPQHVDVTVERLARSFGVRVHAEPAPIAFRETIRAPATGIGKHVKQSGGHGQYGVAQIELTPLPRGAGFAFSNDISGGVIPSQFIPSVEKGIREAMREGPLGGFPVVDLGVRLFDGKHHSVDSSDAAFQMAGILAFRDAMAQTQAVLLEPMMEVDLAIPDDLTGAVMSDLSGRRGRILGTDTVGAGRSIIHAEVPQAELQTYAAEYRALTSGQGTLAMRYRRHEDVPDEVARRLVAARAPA